MSDQSKPRFEPPPWEQEAFERFRKARDEVRAREELDAALRQVRSPEAEAPIEVIQATEESPAIDRPAGVGEAEPSETEGPGSLSEARVNAMLVELRGEESSAPVANKGLIYSTIAFLGVIGTYIIIQSALLFGSVRTDVVAGTLLAGIMSFVVLLIGLGCLGGAFLLFRKYRQYL